MPSLSNARPQARAQATEPAIERGASWGAALLALLVGFGAGCAREAEPARSPGWSPEPTHSYAGYPSYGSYPSYAGYPSYAAQPPAMNYIPMATQFGAGSGYPSGAYPAAPPALAPGQAAPPPMSTPGVPAQAAAQPAALPALPSPPAGAEPARRYGDLSPDSCRAELESRKLAVEAYPPSTATQDVATPVRLTGALNGVRIVMNGAKRPGSQGQLDVMDCRLALSLDDWTKLLAARGVSTLHHASMLRPGARIRQSGKPSQHGLGLAIDIAAVSLSDGTRLEILRDFAGTIGAEVCTQDPANPKSNWLRQWTCETHAGRFFNLILTPNYNADHHDHVHLDLEPGKTWFNLH